MDKTVQTKPVLPIFYDAGLIILVVSLSLIGSSVLLMMFTRLKPEDLTEPMVWFISGAVLFLPSIQLVNFAIDPINFIKFQKEIVSRGTIIFWIITSYSLPDMANHYLQKIGKRIGQKIPDIYSDDYWIYLTSIFISLMCFVTLYYLQKRTVLPEKE